MANLRNMDRYDFIELFGIDIYNPDDIETMECIYEPQHENGKSWFDISKDLIATMDAIIRGIQ